MITNSVPDRPFVESKTSFVLPDGRLAYHVRRSGVRITRTEKGLEKIEDFDTGTTEVYYRGGKIEPIVDSVSNCGIGINPSQIRSKSCRNVGIYKLQ